MPTLNNIDHVHLSVTDRERSVAWFAETLGLEVIEALRHWAAEGGPLTIGDRGGHIHLALFERDTFEPSNTIAFGASGNEFLAWKGHLEQQGIATRCADHKSAWSLYFQDPDGNGLEITTAEHALVAAALTS